MFEPGCRVVVIMSVGLMASAVGAGTTLYVDAGHPCPGSGTEGDPYCSLRNALQVAVDTDEIVVAAGTYVETVDFGGRAVTLRSADGPEVTIIDAHGVGTVVVCDSGEGPGTVLQGFTITGGVGAPGTGGGMYNHQSNPTVINCRFLDNSAATVGGGMYNYDASPTVIDCAFSGNSAAWSGGGMANEGLYEPSSPTVIGCTFTGNTADDGGGMTNLNDAAPTLIGCTFIDNVAFVAGGGMSNSAGSLTVANCTFIGNTATDDGGAVWNSRGYPAITNSTFSGNSAGAAGALYNCCGSVPVVTNCVFWGNGPAGVSGATSVSYSDVQGGWPGVGNINADPLLVDAGGGVLQLSAGSPCIDAGHNWAIAGLAGTDVDGHPRFASDEGDFDPGCGIPAVVDMGACEHQGQPFPVKYGDVDGDGLVGVNDFLLLLGEWGACDAACCLADLDMDGQVGVTDFLILLASWG
ncbi:MAG: right-handed parallel beta-helix repeat-containing protein [Planctomycetota bacterium]